MRKSIAVLTAVMAMSPAAAMAQGPGVPAKTVCPTMRFTAPSVHSERCQGHSTPYVFVNGQELKVVDLSDHHSTATYYGEHTVVQLHQRGSHVRVEAVTVDRRVHVMVIFQP